MRKGIIYKVINHINAKIYIGQTINTLNIRKAGHIFDSFNNKTNIIFHNAIRKYGIDVFEWSIIWEGDKSILSKMEIFYIQKYNSHFKDGYGYNMTYGGENPPVRYGKDHHKYDSKLYTFYHISGKVEKDITFYNMRNKYNIAHQDLRILINNKISTIKQWSMTPSAFLPEFNMKHKHCLFSFVHKNGTKEINITRQYMIKKYDLRACCLSEVCRKKAKHTKNWSLLD